MSVGLGLVPCVLVPDIRCSISIGESAFIELIAKPNFPLLGKRLGKRMKEFQQAINNLGGDDIAALQADGELTVQGEVFTLDEIQVLQQARPGTNTVSNSLIAVDLDCELTPELIRGGYAREIVNRIQRARKDAGFEVSDRIEIVYQAQGELAQAAMEHEAYIMQETLALEFRAGTPGDDAVVSDIDGNALCFQVQQVKQK